MFWLLVLLAATAATFAKLGAQSVLVKALLTALGLALALLGAAVAVLVRRAQDAKPPT